MFFLRGPGDDGDSDIGEDGSCFLHAYYMPSTALGPCLATKQKSNYKHHLTSGTLQLRAETNKKQTNKNLLQFTPNQTNTAFSSLLHFGKSSLLPHGFQSLKPKCTGNHKMMVAGGRAP